MHVEVFFAEANDFLQPRFVTAHGRGRGRFGKLRLECRPQTRKSSIEQGRGEPIERKPAAPLFDDEAGFFQKAQMPRDAGLRDAEHRRELSDVQAAVLPREHAQQPEPHLVAQQPVQLASLLHIHEYISMYIKVQAPSVLHDDTTSTTTR